MADISPTTIAAAAALLGSVLGGLGVIYAKGRADERLDRRVGHLETRLEEDRQVTHERIDRGNTRMDVIAEIVGETRRELAAMKSTVDAISEAACETRDTPSPWWSRASPTSRQPSLGSRPTWS